MCIVSFVQLNSNHWILTHNRDENVFRESSNNLVQRFVNNTPVQMPVDFESNGTWVFSSKQYVACVLNGEFKAHKRQLPYAKSRGNLVLELLNFSKIDHFIDQTNFRNIEPCTLIMLDLQNQERKVLVWDSTIKHVYDFGNENLLVRSSSTLYSKEDKQYNQQVIERIAEKKPENLLQVHQKLKMENNQRYTNIKTTSIVQIQCKNQNMSMDYVTM